MSTSLIADRKLLLKTFRQLKTKQDQAYFIDDLFTEEEILDLAQRLKIAKLILEGKTYEEISTLVNTSTSTVSKIGQIIKFGKGSFSKVFTK
ncbi:helix-turn-helix domain-containing protein [Candidatus Gottesmanbacteria bacterium]|nr:helix-turn-helix domain-containing protein [Candidatus Gottesmanbacteria bacterium]